MYREDCPLETMRLDGLGGTVRHVTVERSDPALPEARWLIEQLDNYLLDLYPPASNHLLPVQALRQAGVTFLVARVDGEVAGCGAFVDRGEYAEVKRMFVLPEFRGLKIGRLLLDELESLARNAGLALARLEAGVLQPEALRLYERAGYFRRGPFGDYPEDPLSVFMEKRLG
jgi:putative acetyltransferase